MRYRRTVGGLAALATVVSGSALALAAPSYAGSSTTPSFPITGTGSAVEVLKGVDGAVTGLLAKDAPIASPKGMTQSPEDAAKSHLERFAEKLGLNADALKPVLSSKVAGGNTVKMQQYIDGLPVVGGEIVASLDHSGGLEALLGETAKGAIEVPKSLLGESKAQLIARRYVAKKADVSAFGLKVESEGRWIYNPSLVGAPGAPVNRETLKFHVSSRDHMVDYTVYVDRGFNSVALAVSNNHEALERKVCDLDNRNVPTMDAAVCDGSTVPFSRQEGEQASGIDEVDKIYDGLGETAKWYANYTNVDVSALIGGEDQSLRATTRVCSDELAGGCPLPNAFWNDSAQQMFYGDGVSAQDVTAHELTHGVTNHTSKLLYIYQSGAINESLSDTMGELIDLASNPDKIGTDQAWLIGEDNSPASSNLPVPLRSMKDPTAFDNPDTLTSDLWDADADHRDSGGVHTNSGPGNKAAYLIAQGDSFNGFDVRGLGLAKTFKIYWTAENLLTSGSDYKDLFHVLPLSCRKNIGKPGTFVTEDDCAQVDKAVRATEMYKDAASAAPVATPYCEDDGTVNASYSQRFDAPTSDWTLAGGAGQMAADFQYNYVNSGADALGLYTETGDIDTSSATSKALSIPAGSLLRIDYATLFSLFQPVEGATATLEYSLDGNAWLPANTLPGSVNGGPWNLHSNGWSSAKYDLTPLAGQDAQFRITVDGVTNDANNPVSLLAVDNFKIYTCS